MRTARGILRTMSSLLIFFLFFSSASAQTDTVFTTADPATLVSIKVSPEHPGPGETVRLTVFGGSLVDLQGSTITWLLNGKNVSKGVGNTTFDIRLGALGQKADIEVRVSSPDGTSAESAVSIVPTHIDLLVDSDSYTPPFYRGRALPSPGTQLHAEARAYLKRPGGSFLPPSSIIYTWRQNGQVVGQVSGKGRWAVTLPSPVLYGTDTISVDVVSSDGALRGFASTQLSSVDPILALYKDHPLFGLMYHQAMGEKTAIPDSEMTFAAILYFGQIHSPADPRLQFKWTVNGAGVPVNTAHPNEITINADKSKGDAAIELSLFHTTNFFVSPKGEWDVMFKTIGRSSAPFLNVFQ